MVSTYAAPSAAPAAVFPSSTVTPSPVTASADRCTFDFTPTSTGQLVIWVWPDGKTPARFILDSGTNYCCITDKMAAQIGLTQKPAVNGAGIAIHADGVQPKMITTPLMQIGTIRYPKFPLIVTDTENLSQLTGAKVDGIIGVFALTQAPVFIDFQKHQITLFYDAPTTTGQLHSIGMDTAASVPPNDHDGDLVFQTAVQLTNGDKKATPNLLVDTGGTNTIIPEATARTLGLREGDDQGYGAIFSSATVRDVIIPSVSFGLPGTDIGSLDAMSVHGKVPSSFGLRIGLDVLTHFQVLLDFGGRKMYLKPVPAPPLNLTYVHPAPTP